MAGPKMGQVQLDNILESGALDPRFEIYLERYGAALNGTTDDAAPLQEAFNAVAAKGGPRAVLFPQGVTANIATAVGSGVSDVSYVGLSIPANLSVDWNGSQLTSSANWGAGDALVAISDAAGAADVYGQNRTLHKRGTWTANSNFDQVLLLGNDNPALGPSRVSFENMLMQNGANIITLGSNAYLGYWKHCEFRGWASAGYAITSFGGSTNSGENFCWDHCAFYNGSGAVLRARGGFYTFISSSMDYVKQVAVCDNASLTQIEFHGCHLEQNSIDAKYATTQYMLEIQSAATASQILMLGGRIVVATGSAGSNLDAIAYSNGSGSAPYGIVLRDVVRSLNGVTLNGAGAGRFVDA